MNIALDLLFIVVFKWGIEGAARATVIAQRDRHVRGPRLREQHHPLLSIKKQDLLFDMGLFKEGLRIGLPSSVQQCAISLGLIALLGIVNSFGTDTLTAYGGSGKDRHDHHPSGIDPLWGASCFLRAKHRSWALGPGT